eukprot:3572592-Prymnesium_polylepis.2
MAAARPRGRGCHGRDSRSPRSQASSTQSAPSKASRACNLTGWQGTWQGRPPASYWSEGHCTAASLVALAARRTQREVRCGQSWGCPPSPCTRRTPPARRHRLTGPSMQQTPCAVALVRWRVAMLSR